ncbi:MAG: ABC transporter substrate-binding protein [Candidatus Methanoperedens sp.]|nr:ABC transporter substrate-binding protein [Candidatus Methanoperedens sp.]
MIEIQQINIGHLSTLYHTSFILMGTEWLEKAGIKANWKLFASGPDIVKAFEKKEIDIGYIGLPPAIIGIDRGVPIICVAGGHVEGTVLIAQKEYRSLSKGEVIGSVMLQFEGRIIGSPPKGSIHDVIINNIINEAKLDIRVKNFPWTDFVLEALIDGDIDAAIGTPPLAVEAMRACQGKIIIPPDRLWKDNPSYGIVIRKEMMKYPEVITQFIELHERASNFIRENTGKAAKLVSGLTRIVDEDFVRDAYAISPKYCSMLSSGFVSSTMDFVPVLHRLKYISNIIPRNEIFDFSFINEVHKEPHHYDS